MRRIPFLLTAAVALMTLGATRAIDVNPSKTVQPPSFYEGGSGSRFSIFNGDPKRIQRVNAVDPKAFDAKVDVSPVPFSIQAVKAASASPGIKITFTVHNHAKKTYTLSFPNAQRWDFRVLNGAGTPIYVYSDNCEFEQKIGSSMVNNDDTLTYSETVQFEDLTEHLAPGVYTVQAVLANYPEIHAETKLTVQQ